MWVQRADCRREYCRFCHRNIPSDVFLSNSYLGNTFASKARFLENIKAKHARMNSTQGLSKHGRKPSLSKSQQKSHLLKLPLEIRLRIYHMCIEESSFTARSLCPWIEGGAWHPDNNSRIRLPPMEFYVSNNVPTNLLAVNRQINLEATRELYRQIHVRMSLPIPVLSQVLTYWLGKHPLRFTKHLTITDGLRWNFGDHGLSYANRGHMLQYATIISMMPDLETLKLSVDGWCGHQDSDTAEFYGRLKPNWLKNLIILREQIRSRINFTVEFADTLSAGYHMITPSLAQIRLGAARELIELLGKQKFVLIRGFEDPFRSRFSFEMARRDGIGSKSRMSSTGERKD